VNVYSRHVSLVALVCECVHVCMCVRVYGLETKHKNTPPIDILEAVLIAVFVDVIRHLLLIFHSI
jgi:hypothetical protein